MDRRKGFEGIYSEPGVGQMGLKPALNFAIVFPLVIVIGGMALPSSSSLLLVLAKQRQDSVRYSVEPPGHRCIGTISDMLHSLSTDMPKKLKWHD